MRKILTSLLLGAVTALSCVAHPVNTNKLNVVYTNTPSEWNDFNWMWSGASDQALEIDFYGQQPSNLFLRLSKPDGSQYLTTQAGSLSDFGTNYRRWSVSIAKSNLPPSNVYRTEILSSSDSTTNIQDAVTLVMAKGRTRVQWSSFDGSPSTNNLWIYGDGWFTEHDLKALNQVVILSNWVEAIRSGMINSNTYLIGYIDSLFLSATQRIHALETGRYTKAQSDARFATTDRVEQVAALVGGGSTSSYTKAESDTKYATTGELAVLNLKVDTATNNLAAQGISAVVASNSFVKKSGDTMTGDLAMGGQNVTNVNSIYGPGSGAFINLDDPIIAGTKAWEFERQPSIPGYLQTTGTYNLASGTNAPAAWTAQPSLLALSNGLAAASALGTNAQITASNAQTTASAATNLALAIGAGATNGILNVGLVATNAQQVASNGLATAQAAQVQASNINAAAWSQVATNAVEMHTNGINQAKWVNIQSGHGGESPPYTLIRTVHSLQYRNHLGTNTIADSSNLSGLGIQTTAGFNNSTTTTLWRWSGFIQGGTGQRGNMYESNGWLYVWSDASNAYGRVQLGF